MKDIFQSSYLKGQVGEAIAQKELKLNKFHIGAWKRLQALVKQKELPKDVLQLFSDYAPVIDLFKIIEQEGVPAEVELYEVKARLWTWIKFTDHRRKSTLGWKTVELQKAAAKLGIIMYVVNVVLYPRWKYTYSVKPLRVEDFIVKGPDKRYIGKKRGVKRFL